jgi:phage gp36-like protein
MNEVIERLKKQAEYVSHEGLGGNYTQVDLDEFAKLIVLECSRVAKLEVCTNRVCDAIEHHFGIES